MNPPPDTRERDDGLEWLRDIRRRVAVAHGFDPARYAEHLRKVQAARIDRLFDPREAIAAAARNP